MRTPRVVTLGGILLTLACCVTAAGGGRSFDLRGDARTLFDNVAGMYGIQCRFDPDYQSGAAIHFRIDDADFTTAIRALEAATGSFTVPLSSNLMLVAADTPAKRTELEPYVSMTVDIPQATTPEELRNLVTAVQQVMALQKIAIDTDQRRVVLRGPASTVVPARVLLEGLLQYPADVSIELKVIEVSRHDLLMYGLDLPTTLQLVNLDALAKTPNAVAALVRGGLGGLYSFNIASAALLAQMEHSQGNTLLDLEARSRDHGTVTFHSGDRFPVLTAAFTGPGTPTGSGGGGSDGSGGAPSPGSFGNAPGPAAVAVADFNQDGLADFAAAVSGDDAVYVYLGRGDGTFGDPARIPTGAVPVAIATADVNGDRRADLIVANSGSNTLSVLLGRADGGFDRAADLTTGMRPSSLAVADFDGDGMADIVAANVDSGDLSFFLGAGDGSFRQGDAPLLSAAASSVRAADLNGDGVPDLAVVSSVSSELSVFLAAGDGTFRAPVRYSTGKEPVAVAAGDLNLDGTVDLVTANSGDATVSVFFGDGRGGFAHGVAYPAGASPSDVAIRDFNVDGVPDVATVAPDEGAIFLLPGQRTALLPAIAFHTGARPAALGVGDWNRDGVPDLLTANRLSNNFSVLVGMSSGGYQDPSGQSFPATGQNYAPIPQFQFEDLGLVVKATPHINGESNITLVLDAESKGLTGRYASGIPVISNRKLSTEVQVRSGEWVAIGGLLSESDARDAAGIPVIGKHTREKTGDQILILIRANLLGIPPEDPAPVPLGSETRPRTPL